MEPLTDGLIINKEAEIDMGVLHVTLSDGESIIGHVWRNVAAKEYTVDHPVFPNMAQNPDTGKVSVALLPLRPYLNKNLKSITLQDQHVVYTAPIRQDMENLYRQFTSDIVLADEGDLHRILTRS